MPERPELPAKLPEHVAIIMDGNGRWAKAHGKPRLEGHYEGTERVLEISRACREWGIRILTLYAFSTENWKRPEDEVVGLMELLRQFLINNRQELIDNETRLITIGDLSKIPQATRDEIEKTASETAGFEKHILNIALNYGGRAEIIRAIRGIAQDVADGNLSVDGIDDDVVSGRLYTAGQPDPDLMIRTSGEQRISNYLLWQLAYSEFAFPKVPWPEFGREAFAKCLREFGNRERRFGLTGDQLNSTS